MHIQKIVNALPPLKSTTVIIAQHMARGFIPSFIKRLKEHSINPIDKAHDGDTLQIGHVYVCIGYTEVVKREGAYRVVQSPSPDTTYNPDINLMFKSIVPFVDDFNLLSVILTGIGEDGVEGCRLLGERKVRCLTETAESAVVDGMPLRAREVVPNIEALSLDKIVEVIRGFCR